MLDGGLLYPEAKPGDVMKADAEFELEGIQIISVVKPRTDNRTEPQRIEIIPRAEGPGVTTQLVGRRPGDRRDRDDSRGDRRRDRDDSRGGRRPERDDSRGGRRERTADRPPDSGRPRRERTDDRPASSRPRPERRDGEGRRKREEAPAADGARTRERSAAADKAQREKARRLNPRNTHRRAVLESMAAEERPIAEQVLRGGIPAVRTALHLEREKAVSEGRPAPNIDDLIAMAESLLPRLKAAEWRDRAEAAVAAGDEITLRDLRSVVAGADLARDEETRGLATQLREALEHRITALHQQWYGDIGQQLDGNHVVRALRLSGRPPEPGARLTVELSERLADAAGRSMSPDTPPERWMALLDSASESPVRRSVKPVGLPENAPPDLKRSAHQHSGSIPSLAALLGISMPPPPIPIAARGKPASRRPPKKRADRQTPAEPTDKTPDTPAEPTDKTPDTPAGPTDEIPYTPAEPTETPTESTDAQPPAEPTDAGEAQPEIDPTTHGGDTQPPTEDTPS